MIHSKFVTNSSFRFIINIVACSLIFASCSPISQENLTRTNTDIVKQTTKQMTLLPGSAESVRLVTKANDTKLCESLNLTLYSETYIDSIETQVSTVHRTVTKSEPMLGSRSYVQIVLGLTAGAVAVPYITKGVKNADDRAANLVVAGALFGLSYSSFATYFSLADEETTFSITDTLRVWRSLNKTTPLASQQVQIRRVNLGNSALNVNLDQTGSATVPLVDLVGTKLLTQTVGQIETPVGNTTLILPQEIVEYVIRSYIEQKDWSTLDNILKQKDVPDPILKSVATAYKNHQNEEIAQSQKSSGTKSQPKKTEARVKLNPSQIYFVSRLHYDLQNAKRKDAIYFFFHQAYGGTNVPLWEVERRISVGLKDSTNLPAVVAMARAYYDRRMAVVTLNEVLPSLDYEECEHLNTISDSELRALAGKYTRYLKQADNIEKY